LKRGGRLKQGKRVVSRERKKEENAWGGRERGELITKKYQRGRGEKAGKKNDVRSTRESHFGGEGHQRKEKREKQKESQNSKKPGAETRRKERQEASFYQSKLPKPKGKNLLGTGGR